MPTPAVDVPMTQKAFLTVISMVALGVGMLALAFPDVLLQSKGVLPSATTLIWVRQTGILILATGLSSYLVRNHGDSATLRSLLFSNAVLQVGILPVELLAYRSGAIPTLAGVIPNSIFHVLAGLGFAYFAFKMRQREREGVSLSA